MRMLSPGRVFAAASLTIFAVAATASPAAVQSFAPDASIVAPDASTVAGGELRGARIAKAAGFVLVAHGNWVAASNSVYPSRTTDASQRSVPRTSASASTRPAAKSSAARDKVILHIRAAEVRHGLPSGLLDALVAAESNYRPNVVSKAGAAGLAQLMPATARSLGVFDRFDVRANLDGGARYLRRMIDRFGSIAMALAAYNAGPGAVLRAGAIPQNGETPGYVARVLTNWRSPWR